MAAVEVKKQRGGADNFGIREFQKNKKHKRIDRSLVSYKPKHFERKGARVDDDTCQYFLQVLELINQVFKKDADRDVFVHNVFEETIDRELQLASNQGVSRVIEKLLPMADDSVLLRFADVFGNSLNVACTDRFASFVLEKLLLVALQKSRIDSNKEDKGSKFASKFSEWILKVSSFCANNLEDFVWHQYANHVVRSVLICLSGTSPSKTVHKSRKWQHMTKGVEEPVLYIKREDIPPEFMKSLIDISDRLQRWPQLPELGEYELPSGLLQSLLHALHHAQPHTAKELVTVLLDKCFAQDVEEPSELPQYFYKSSCNHLLESCLNVADNELFTKIYNKFYKTRLQTLSEHPEAYITVRKAFNLCNKKEQFEEMFDELADGFKEILPVENGVIVSLVQACRRLSAKQGTFVKKLIQSFNCFEPEERQVLVVPLVAKMIAYDDYNTQTSKFVPFHLHGCLILQAMLNFDKPSRIVKSLLAMDPTDLKILACDLNGSIIVNALFSSNFVGEKSRDKVIQKLKDQYIFMACSRFGFLRVHDIWDAANIKQKLFIAQILAPKEAVLNSNKYGRIVAEKLALSLFNRKQSDWTDFQSNEFKKRKLEDTIGDLPESSKKPKKICGDTIEMTQESIDEIAPEKQDQEKKKKKGKKKL